MSQASNAIAAAALSAIISTTTGSVPAVADAAAQAGVPESAQQAGDVQAISAEAQMSKASE